MGTLSEILLRAIPKNRRTCRYQEQIDRHVERMKQEWDIERGLLGSRGIALPHETLPGYWELPDAERARVTVPEAANVYAQSAGRAGTAPLVLAAFAWHSPHSRFHRDPELLRFFERGLDFFTGAIRRDGSWGMYGLNGLTWAHGWDVEGLIYGLVFTGEALDRAVRERALERLRLSGQRFFELGRSGTHGNQGCVQALGLWLYGQFFARLDWVQAADERWRELVDRVLDDSGQVIEQHGPCMHYSYTCFVYAWLNAFVRGGDGQEERIERCLRWFRARHTESLYPMAGPSSRQYYEKLSPVAIDLVPALEHLASREPNFQRLADRIVERVPGDRATGHGGSPWMWAMVACSEEWAPGAGHRAAWSAPFERYYEIMKLYGRSPLKYVLVKRAYQTNFNLCDFLPFSGIQTWALEDEPPIVHPTKLAPSTTQAWGLDTARQGVSHNWGQFGAGVMAADGRYMPGSEPGAPSFLVARYDRLWRVAVFTDRSTVLLEFGDTGPRKTLWTLNRVEPAVAKIGEGVVSFAGRRGRIHTTVSKPPALRELGPGEWTAGVKVLEYDCGEGLCAFALSDESFRFEGGGRLADRTLLFSDASGAYRVMLCEKFFAAENPGNCTIDVWHLAGETKVERRL